MTRRSRAAYGYESRVVSADIVVGLKLVWNLLLKILFSDLKNKILPMSATNKVT